MFLGSYNEETLLDDPYQLIRMEILSLILIDGFRNPDQRAKIDQCLIEMEEMYQECDESFLSILMFIYTLSKINNKKYPISAVS